MNRLVELLERFFSSWRFPVMTLAIMLGSELFLIAMLLIPAGAAGVGAFAEEFRTWCFGYDPATGELELGYVVMLLAHPPVLGTVTVVVWYRPLAQVLRSPRRLFPYVGSAAVVVGLAVALLGSMRSEASATELPFPAETLRLSQPAPDFALADQDGREVRVSDFAGRVTLVTGIYASCAHTCPLILAQTRRALAALEPEQRERVTVVAVTLDPARDGPEVLRALSARENAPAPAYRFLSGPPRDVEAALDALDITRRKDPHSGVIDHANLFLLYDQRSRLAYRLTLGERQERWLVQALRVLLSE